MGFDDPITHFFFTATHDSDRCMIQLRVLVFLFSINRVSCIDKRANASRKCGDNVGQASTMQMSEGYCESTSSNRWFKSSSFRWPTTGKASHRIATQQVSHRLKDSQNHRCFGRFHCAKSEMASLLASPVPEHRKTLGNQRDVQVQDRPHFSSL